MNALYRENSDHDMGNEANEALRLEELIMNESLDVVADLRAGRVWNDVAFRLMIGHMYKYCQLSEGRAILTRNAAYEFWYMPWVVRSYCEDDHPVVGADRLYLATARESLDDLAYWYFTGEPSHLSPEVILERLGLDREADGP